MLRRLLSKLNAKSPSPPMPQLEMLRDTLKNLPAIRIPDGYGLRTYRSGDEAAWCAIMEGNVGRDWTPETCREKLVNDPRFLPESLFFATIDSRPVGSACAWSRDLTERVVGEVHMVAVLENQRGKGLGHLVNAAVLHRLKDLDYRQAHLLTDDWRLAAVRSYLTAGFRPLHTHDSHAKRWSDIFIRLGIEHG